MKSTGLSVRFGVNKKTCGMWCRGRIFQRNVLSTALCHMQHFPVKH